MGAQKSSKDALFSVEVFDGVVWVEHDGPWAMFRGSAQALVDADLILEDWPPQGRKRIAYSARPWGAWADWDEGRCVDRDSVRTWYIKRLAGGDLELSVHPTFMRHFLDGPEDSSAPQRAARRHIALVRARRDAAFRRFLAAAFSSNPKGA